MHVVKCSIIDKLQTWIGSSDRSALINKVERDHLGIFTVQRIRDETYTKITITIASMLDTKKRE